MRRSTACGVALVLLLAAARADRVCSRYEACGVIDYTLADYDNEPTEEEVSTTIEEPTTTTTDIVVDLLSADNTTADNNATDDSIDYAEGSGEAVLREAPMFYHNEPPRTTTVRRPPPPLNATIASTRRFELCRCDGDDVCPLANATTSDHSIRLDAYVELRVCHPVGQLVPRTCRGRRGVIRVIGEVDVDAIEQKDNVHEYTINSFGTYNETLLFCHCPNGKYTRSGIEPWRHGFLQSLQYVCS